VTKHSSLTTHTEEEMVGATGIEPVTPTMSTQQSAAATRCKLLLKFNYSCGGWYARKIRSANGSVKSAYISTV